MFPRGGVGEVVQGSAEERLLPKWDRMLFWNVLSERSSGSEWSPLFPIDLRS